MGPRDVDRPEVNAAGADDYYPTLTRSGTLVFSSNRPGGLGENDIYRARRVDGRWTTPENLGVPVNSASREYDPFIAPDESYLVFASERPGGLGGADLYVERAAAGRRVGSPDQPRSWRELGEQRLHADGDAGRALPVPHERSEGSDDLYWVAASVIEETRGRNGPGSVPR